MQALHGLLHRLEQVAGVQVIDQVGDHFGVGLALEYVAQRRQFGAQFVVVFNDAVVHQRDAGVVRIRREVRVGIVRSRRAVRGPAGMSDAREALQADFLHLLFQFRHARRAARALQAAIRVQSHAARIVAAVFQAFQAFDQDRGDITLRYRADDAAHVDLYSEC
jgi:hypothetical protein